MNKFSEKVILNSVTGYSENHDKFLLGLINAKVKLICAVGRDCELWHDVLDELFVGDGTIERDFNLVTTWHDDDTLEQVVEFARFFHIDHGDNETIQVIQI